MKSRRHHNNTGYRGIKTGKTTKSLEIMAVRIFRKRLEKVGNKLFIKEDVNGQQQHILGKDGG